LAQRPADTLLVSRALRDIHLNSGQIQKARITCGLYCQWQTKIQDDKENS